VTKFRHIPAAGRVIIVGVAIGVFIIAALSCWTSYNAIYRLVVMLGLYGYRTNQVFPLLVDLAFLVGESAAILGGIMRAVTRSDEVTRGWPFTAMLLCGAGTVAFNVWHAYLIGGRGDPLTVARCVVASLPPLLMIVSFQVLISIVKWVMLHLGRPLNSAAVLSPTEGMPGMLPGPVPGAAYPYGPAFGWPGAYGELPPGQAPVWWQTGQTSSATRSGNPQAGHADGAADVTKKREYIEAYLGGLGPDQRKVTTGSGIVAALAEQGIAVDERYARRVLDEWTVARRGNGARRRRNG
jgi:hypothetical protein